MALLKSVASGNFTSASTWALCTAVNDGFSSNSNSIIFSTTSYVLQNASSFSSTVNANATGVLVKIAARASTSGTFSVALYANDGTTLLGECTMNVTDIAGSSLPTSGTTAEYGHWVFFKFSTPIAITNGTFYRVAYKSSISGSIGLNRTSAVTGVISSAIVTDITQAPAATDRFIVVGDNVASATNPGTTAGTKVAYTVTMDNTNATQFGDGLGTVVSIPYWSLYVGDNATLQYGVASSVNYNLRIRGSIAIGAGGDSFPGVFTMGTQANPVPRDSTARLELDSAAVGNSGFQIQGGTFITRGLSRTAGLNIDRCLLNADYTAGGTTLTVDTNTGWLSGDEIFLGRTERVSTGPNLLNLASNATATTLTLTASTTPNRDGNSVIKAMVGLVTRNVTVIGTTATGYGRIYGTTSVVNCDWTCFRNLGMNTAGVRIATFLVDGNPVNTIFTNSIIIGSAFHGLFGSSTASGAIVDNCLFVSNGSRSISFASGNASTTSITNCWFAGADTGIILRDTNLTLNNLRICGCGTQGITITNPSGTAIKTSTPTIFSNVLIHSCGRGLNLNTQFDNGDLIIDNFEIQRCSAQHGLGLSSGVTGIIIRNSRIWGNSGRNIYILGSVGYIWFQNCDIAGQTLGSNDTIAMMEGGTYSNSFVYFENCRSGAYFTGASNHTSADIYFPTGSSGNIFARNCLFNSPQTVVTVNTNSFTIVSENHNQVAGTKRVWLRYGIISSDTTISRTGTRSLRLTPNSSLYKLEYVFSRTAVASGTTPTIGVYVRKSVAGDGAAYNGNQPRLIVKRNILVGINSDTVIATATNAANGSWQLLSGSLPTLTGDGIVEIEVDCDGTTGWVNIDDFQPPSPVDTRSFSISDDTLGVVSYGNNTSGGGGSLILPRAMNGGYSA